MDTSLEINGKLFVPAREAARAFGYSCDHVTRLAKSKKVLAIQQGRLWFVGQESLSSYLADQKNESLVRKQMLRKERQHDLQMRTLAAKTQDSSGQVDIEQQAHRSTLVLAALFVGAFLFLAGKVFPVSTISTAAVHGSVEHYSSMVESEVVHPVFTSKEKVAVGSGDRWVEKPEVTSNWTQITP